MTIDIAKCSRYCPLLNDVVSINDCIECCNYCKETDCVYSEENEKEENK
jgi:hypothetical protein